MAINILIIVFAALTVQFTLRRDFDKGVAAAAFFLILLPREVQIPMPGALPELTGHRTVLLVLLFNVLPRLNRSILAPVSPVVSLLCVVAVCRFLSTFTAISPSASIKVLIGYVIETVLFFVVFASSLRSLRTIELVTRASLLALVGVAVIATIEKYTGRNLAAMYIPGMLESPVDVCATFRHRILLGYAMAMGFPLALVWKRASETPWGRWVPRVGLLLLVAACYYAHSRGPWVGCALGGAALAAAGGKVLRRKLTILGIIAVFALATHPGVYDTISGLWHQSFDQNTIKGKSADYRLILWKAAYGELTKSFGHTLFGYGGHSTELMDVSKYFDRGGGGLADELGHTSWDSQFASNFTQYGFVGFGVEVLVYLTILKLLYQTWRNSHGADREFVTACIAVVLIFFWAMATVAIFNPQLDFLFWITVAMVGRFQFVTAAEPVEIVAEIDTDFISSEPRAEGGTLYSS